ncbi:hypothetical protein LOZ61_004811 [Ophidiomyces ophidiicola]|nr:hypothetical protein LOZ61_004811 [Ophidiomyces ophidiicola]KAI1924646.1 hypothetical protein LOZ60_004566 [Ophidiomyces ophidiicola]KAI1955053.1 hypothetical protein LOZ59_004729 [Ophidiomyces ophidiicola]KAI2021543.1 hypothetical protein LOZ45_004685 [Ophidiomyces ophidiicola]KAI2035942.1 hypothetical protein LOZ48_001101 [Ophidiomyces ophidiicola]
MLSVRMHAYQLFLSAIFSSFAVFTLAVDLETDVVVVGGGPAGLSSLSSLARVRRKAILFDSREYRNGNYERVHDVIGSSDLMPESLRSKGRAEISAYAETASFRMGVTVDSIVPMPKGVTTLFHIVDSENKTYSARKIILATGIKDRLPNYIMDSGSIGPGIYWCPWCSGYENRDVPIGILGRMSDVLDTVLEISTLNGNITAFVDGTDTLEENRLAKEKYPRWREQLQKYQVRIENRTIKAIERLSTFNGHQPPEVDLRSNLFKVHFADGSVTERNAFVYNFPTDQRSPLAARLGLQITKDGKIKTIISSMRTSSDGVFAVGDANSDGSTNVVHAMWSGKKAAIEAHKDIERENSLSINQDDRPVVIKSVEGHWRLKNERDVLDRFQARSSHLRPLLDEIEDPTEPPSIVLRYLDDDLTRAEEKQRLTRQEIKYIAKHLLEGLQTLHKDGFVHTGSNVLVNYGECEHRFVEVQLADLGGAVSENSEFAKKGIMTGTNVFRAPEVHLELPWGTASDIWSFGVTLINQIWGLNFHIFEPRNIGKEESYDLHVLMKQHEWFGPFPHSMKDIVDEGADKIISYIFENVERVGTFPYVKEREICDIDKAFILKIMKLDPRDRPTAADLLHDEWFTEKSERTVGWYSVDEWREMEKAKRATG